MAAGPGSPIAMVGLPVGTYISRFLAAARSADVLFSISEEGSSLLLAALGAAQLRRPLVIAAQTPMAESIRD